MGASFLADPRSVKGDLGALRTNDSSSISLTLKNYKLPTGLSTRIHKTTFD